MFKNKISNLLKNDSQILKNKFNTIIFRKFFVNDYHEDTKRSKIKFKINSSKILR